MAIAQEIIGRASVIDGDTIEIAGESIRLNGIDVPERAQPCQDAGGKSYRCGAVTANTLDQYLSQSRPTRCVFVERDRYGRFVGDCFRADGVNVAAWLVRNGLALDWPRYSQGAYAREEAAAKADRIGLWAGSFQPPWEWRAKQRQQEPAAQVAPLIGQGAAGAAREAGGCDIKGNISRKGERIYHVPGQRDYGKTVISPSKGERWFCSEEEARAAGWRRARR